ncbi:MAG: calcium-binding protein [Aestuariivirga sp.]
MARYVRFGTAATVFLVYSGTSLESHMLARSATSFTFENADGSVTSVDGTGLTYDANGRVTGGTITTIYHYSAGTYNDAFYDLSLSATAFQSMLEAPGGPASRDLALRQFLHSGDDFIDARYRLNDAVQGEVLKSFGGNDTVYGGAGGDTIFGGVGDDVLEGRGGNDSIHGEDGADTLKGEAGDDFLLDLDTVTGKVDYMSGGSGDDIIIGGAGNDQIDAGIGEDVIKGGAGNDTIYGGPDPDTIVYEGLWSELSASYIGSDYSVVVASREGTDKIFAALRIAADDATWRYDVPTATWLKESATSGTELLYPGRVVSGTAGNDTITVAAANATGSVVRGYDGADTIKGAELVWAGAGNDIVSNSQRVFGELGDDTLSGARYAHGGDGNDRVTGTAGDNLLHGDAGVDDVRGASGNDNLDGGAGDDRWLAGEAGNDSVSGGDGNDRVDGGDGNDVLRGGAGNDYVTAGDGDDTIEGGSGNDTIYGGAGYDLFDFNSGSGADAIQDFADDVDTLRIDPAFGFANVAQVIAATAASGNNARVQLPDGSAIVLTNYLLGHTIASLADDIVIG